MRQPTPMAPQLTVAEALVLQNPNQAQGRAAVKLTMMDLLARRILTLRQEERTGRLGRRHTTEYVDLAPDAARQFSQPTHVRALIDAISAAGKDGGSPTMQQVVASARKSFGSDLGGFQTKYVVPRLVERGLLEATKHKVLFVFSRTRFAHTTAGQMALQQIQEQMAQAQAIPKLLDDARPGEVLALVAGLGSSILLVDELRPHYGRLAQAVRQHSSDGGEASVAAMGASGSGPDSEDREVDVPDLSSEVSNGFDALDFGGFDLNAFDSLDSSLDAFDSSFDSSADSGDGSDSGGDSGGSD